MGTYEFVEISTVPTTDKAVEIIITLRLVTDRRRTEEMRARMAAIVESSQDAITGADINGIVTSWNHGAEKIFNIRPTKL